MVSPDHFDIRYRINPHMVDENGDLKKINRALAMQQWLTLQTIFMDLGLEVETLDGQPEVPDMVFCANQTFPFIKDGVRSIVLSLMGSPERQKEVEYFSTWARVNNYKVYEVSSSTFEGMGDALWNYETGEVYGGYGFRTQPEVYNELEKVTGLKFILLELVSETFYHLDTCLSILNKDTAVYVPEAFSTEGLEILKKKFKTLIRVPLFEAENFLAGNCCTPNGKDVIIQQGAEETVELLASHGFNIIETDTSEFLKSGGSVFCMKQLLFPRLDA